MKIGTWSSFFSLGGSPSLYIISALLMVPAPAYSFYCENNALADADDYYCGDDRGSYVLRPDGSALWVTAKTDDQPMVMVRDNVEGAGLMDRILIEYGDLIGDSFVTGVGSNPHMGTGGDSILQVVLSKVGPPDEVSSLPNYNYRQLGSTQNTAMLVAPSGGDVTIVAEGGQPLEGTDADVCAGEALQPWPVMGAGGHYIYGATIQDSLGRCERAIYGDSDVRESGTENGWCATDERALANEFAVAKITRMIIGPFPEGSSSYCNDLPWEMHYEVVEGKTVDVGVPGTRRGSILTPLGIAYADPSEQICEYADTATVVLSQTQWENQSDWETPGVIKGVHNTCDYTFKTRFCPASDKQACNLDTSNWGVFLYQNPANESYAPPYVDISSFERPPASGVRAIARGQVGSPNQDIIARAVRLPRSESEPQMSVQARVADGNERADNPALVDGAVTYWLRAADAISHAGNMVAPDGSTVLRVGAQAAPSKVYFSGDEGDYEGRNLNSGYWHSMVLHVNSAGEANVAGNADLDFKRLSGAQVTSDGGAIYRSYHDDRDRDVATSDLGRYWFKGTVSNPIGSAPGAIPTGEGAARAGTWYPPNVGSTSANSSRLCRAAGVDPDFSVTGSCANLRSLDCDDRYMECSITVTSDNPADASAWSVSISTEELATADWLTYAADGELYFRIATADVYRAMRMYDQAAATDALNPGPYMYFPLSAVSTTILGGGAADEDRLYSWPLELNKWTAAGGVGTLYSSGSVSPAGFSLMAGIPKHFSEGAGRVGLKVKLETPYLGVPGAGPGNFNPYLLDRSDETSFLESILGDSDPCRDNYDDYRGGGGIDYRAYNNYAGGSACNAIMMIEGGVTTEIARTKAAEFVFAQEDDVTKTGVSGVAGFTFVEFGATVAVSDSGTVFFTAGTRDLPPEGAPAACTRGNADTLNEDDGARGGVFSYSNGLVEKVVGEGDMIDLYGEPAFVKAISLPQPELRQAVAGESIMLKMAVDTDGDCLEDTVGLVKVATPSSSPDSDRVLYTPDKGSFASVVDPYAGVVRVINRSAADGWQLSELRRLNPSDAEFLSEAQTTGGLYAFEAVWCKNLDGTLLDDATRPAVCPETSGSLASTTPTSSLELDVVMDVSKDDLLEIVKDLSGTPVMAGADDITETESGGSMFTLTIADGSAFDLDPDMGEIKDPFGASVFLATLVPSVPVPVFGQGLWLMLAGLMSLLGGAFAWRRESRK
ncbi:MAG: hypothetical protein ISP97_00680 [Luminiphilus sp.]|nr:hypothetical protein [Luminiphilus sp.]